MSSMMSPPFFQRSSLLGILSILIGCSWATAAQATVQTTVVQVDPVRAVFSANEGNPCLKNPQIKITRSNQTLLKAPLSTRNSLCHLLEMQVRDLDGDREPEVLLNLDTGGASGCCQFSVVYRYDARNQRYTAIERSWQNGRGYDLQDLDLDGIPEFVTQDDRFDHWAAGTARSPYHPLRILQYAQGEWLDVTRRYPRLIAQDANQLWQAYRPGKTPRELAENRSLLAAYLADQVLLDQEDSGWQKVQTAYPGSDRREFVQALRTFLQQTGYSRSANHSTQAQPPEVAALFRASLPQLQQATSLPILLPTKLPYTLRETTDDQQFFVETQGDTTRYSVTISSAPHCGSNVCFVGVFRGQVPQNSQASDREIFNQIERIPSEQPVALTNGVQGLYKPMSCGGSCAPPNIRWVWRGAIYSIGLKVDGPYNLSAQDRRRLMVDLANSAIRYGLATAGTTSAASH